MIFLRYLHIALFHQSILGNHNSMRPNEALLSTNPLLKRPRFEIGSHLPIYPQRPGQKDCAHYMLTRTCKFGDTCKFDHPLWVPEGGIPDWKEVNIYNYVYSKWVPITVYYAIYIFLKRFTLYF